VLASYRLIDDPDVSVTVYSSRSCSSAATRGTARSECGFEEASKFAPDTLLDQPVEAAPGPDSGRHQRSDVAEVIEGIEAETRQPVRGPYDDEGDAPTDDAP
jgi:hypothetical protein